jgi:aspartyl-tRNA(Asn)/glutamyl-tRNA(Gln) amidotransferase subunit A
VTHLYEGIAGWRMALAVGEYVTDCAAEVSRAVHSAARAFKDLGASVAEVEVGQLREAAQANGLITTADAAAFHHERLERAPQDFGADVRSRLCRGAAYTSGEYVRARRTQTVLRREFERWFTDYDAVLMPTTPIAAPLREGLDAVEAAAQLTRFTAPFNLTGLPALSVPCGFTADGLPIGLQIVGAPWSEASVLRAGYAYEQATRWNERAPPV